MVKEDFVRADGMVPIMTPDGDIIWEPYEPEVLPDGSVVNPWDETPVANDPIDMSLAQFRQLPDSGVITMDDIRKEVSVSGTCNLNQQEFRDLIDKSSGQQQAMSEYWGKSASKAGQGEIGVGGKCFMSPLTGGDRQWGENRAYNKDGYCGWENKTQSTTGYWSSIAEWNLGFDSLRDRTQNVRISYRSMNSCSPRNSNLRLSANNSLMCGESDSAQDHGYFFNPKLGVNQIDSNRNNGSFIFGDIDRNDNKIQWAMLNDGAVGYAPGGFPNDLNGCDPEYSFINKAGIATDPSKLANGGKDPYPLRFMHSCIWGNYVNAVHRTLYIKMENA